MKSSRLTAFQSLMWEWSQLAPYNFVHAMRLDAPLELERWQKAVVAVTRQLDLGASNIRFEHLSGDIETRLQSELLRPFSATDAPLRFFAITEMSGGYWFGATIDHWFADDFSCRLLLEQIYATYRAGVSSAEPVAFLMGSSPPAATRWWRNWSHFIKETMELRRACRTSLRDPADFAVRIFRVVLPEAALKASRALAKRHGATLHDLFLAATAQAFSAARTWEPGKRRDRIAMASAIDLRRFDSERAPNRFGLNIGYYSVTAHRPHQHSLGEVAENISAQTQRFKADAITDRHKPALFLWRLSASKRSKATHYQRGAPLVAGLSNVNLTGSWIEQSEIREFRRIGPTGPVVPMVLMITTLRGRIHFDVTYRTTAFNEETARRVVNDIVGRLPQL